jgi:hypothetical protein
MGRRDVKCAGSALAPSLGMKSAFVMLGALACTDPISSNGTTASSTYDGFELTADVTPEFTGAETIHATVSEITVSSSTGLTIGAVTAFEPQGSADEVVGVRVVDGAVGTPMIAVTTVLGGHRESKTYASLYMIDERSVRRMYSAVVVEVEDESVFEGGLLVLPGILIYRAPRAERPVTLVFDSRTRQYLPSP